MRHFGVAVLAALLVAALCGGAHATGTPDAPCGCEDCDECEGDMSGVQCKEFKCLDNVCRIMKKYNCCPNQLCEENENYGNCPGDCQPKTINIEVLSPVAGAEYMRGEDVLFKVAADADGRVIASADINIDGALGLIGFYNDGAHGDDLLGDNVYANTAAVPRSIAPGTHKLTLNAFFMVISTQHEIELVVDPGMDGVLSLADRLMLGQMVNITGNVSKRGQGMKMWLDVTIECSGCEKPELEGSEIFSGSVESSGDGEFSIGYHTSLLDPDGNWLVSVYGEDEHGNYVRLEKEVELTKPAAIMPLEVDLLSNINEFYRRGDRMNVVVKAYSDGKIVSDAKAELFWGDNKTSLQELQTGQYSASVGIPYSTRLGITDFRVVIGTVDQNMAYKGVEDFYTEISKAELAVRIIEPERRSFKVGEEIEMLVEVAYPTDELVTTAGVKALVVEQEIELLPVTKGAFSAKFVPKETDAGSRKIFFGAEDEFGNTGYESINIEVAGKAAEYYAHQYGIFIGAFVAGIMVVLGYIYYQTTKRRSLEGLQQKERDVRERMQNLQDQYFKQHAMGKDNYRELLAKYELEMQEIIKTIEQVRKKKDAAGHVERGRGKETGKGVGEGMGKKTGAAGKETSEGMGGNQNENHSK